MRVACVYILLCYPLNATTSKNYIQFDFGAEISHVYTILLICYMQHSNCIHYEFETAWLGSSVGKIMVCIIDIYAIDPTADVMKVVLKLASTFVFK